MLLSKRRTLSLALLTMLTLSSAASAQNSRLLHTFPGDQVYPESVAVDWATGVFYVGSVKEGTLFRGRVGRAQMEVISPAGADGRTIANGLFYARGRLVVLGRQSGQIYVYDTHNSQLLAKLHNGLSGNEQTFLNDVVIAPDGNAYVTDSVNPVLYRVRQIGAQYQLDEFMRFDGSAINYVKAKGEEGINVNGIAATKDGRFLIVAKRNENALFRIDLRARQIARIDLGASAIETPDGLFLDGTTLYVAQNKPRSVAVLQFSPDFVRAHLARTISDPTFAFPTAVARFGNKLLIVSSQFDTKGSPAAVSGDNPPQLPFWVTELPVPGLQQQSRQPMARERPGTVGRGAGD